MKSLQRKSTGSGRELAWRSRHGLPIVALATLFCLLVAAPVYAGTLQWYPYPSSTYSFSHWPTDDKWKAFQGLDDGAPETALALHPEVDFVGDANYPGFYSYYDSASGYLFFRIRVAVGTVTTSTFDQCMSMWIYIGTSGTANPSYAFAWDSYSNQPAQHGLEMMANTGTAATYWSQLMFQDVDGNSGVKIAPPDFNNTTNGDGAIRTIDGQPANFNDGKGTVNTTFIDIAIKNTYLTDKSTTGLNVIGQTWNIQLGSCYKENDHKDIDGATYADIAGGATPGSTISTTWKTINPLTYVDLESFEAAPLASGILLRWQTATELDNAGFNLWRALGNSDEYVKINESLIPAEGNGALGAEYSFQDNQVSANAPYRYKLEDIDSAGVSTFHGPIVGSLGTAILTESPTPGSIVFKSGRPPFAWYSQGAERFDLEFSDRRRFTRILSIPTHVETDSRDRLFKGSYTPSWREWQTVLFKFRKKNEPIYWRIKGKDAYGFLYRSNAASFLLNQKKF